MATTVIDPFREYGRAFGQRAGEQIDFASLTPEIAGLLLGEPNRRLSSKAELRYGTKGSLSVDLENGRYYDHEAQTGGGVLDLIQRELKCDVAGAMSWLEEVGLKGKEPIPIGSRGANAPCRPRSASALYEYADERGKVVSQVKRSADKQFIQLGPDGRGGFHSRKGCMEGVRRVPYRLPELLSADPARVVFVTEGEKDADRLAGLGFIATCNSQGAGKFGHELVPHFAGRKVVILADNDEAGRSHAADVAAKLFGTASAVAVVELPDLPPKGDVSDWLDAGGDGETLKAIALAALDRPISAMATANDADPRISATPFVWRDPSTIPLRPWIYGRWLLRNTVTAVVAPGGIGKSSLMASLALSLATGKPLLGKTVWEGPQRAWYWNLEDDGDELDRQIQAAAKLHSVTPDQCGERLFVDSGMEGAGLCVATEDHTGFRILEPVVQSLVDELTDRKIDVLIVDPFVSSHEVGENDNSKIDAVAKLWGRVAKRTNCAIVLVHHTKKMAGQKVTAEASRGAVALINAARTALVLNRMDPDEGVRFGITDDAERRRFFTVQDDKHNRAPAEDAEWYRIASVDLGNGRMGHGDNIGVIVGWTPPDTFDGISVDHLRKVQKAIDGGAYRKSDQSPDWAGHAVAEVLDLDMQDKGDRARVKRMLAEWLKNGALAEEMRKDGKSNQRPFIAVGRWVDDNSSPPHQRVGKGEEVGAAFPTTTTPIKGVGGEEERNRGGGGYEWASDDDPAVSAFNRGEGYGA